MARDNYVRIDRIAVCADEPNVVVDAGILVFMQWCELRGVFTLIDQRLPQPGTRSRLAAAAGRRGTAACA